jgi:hypothetical protein
MALLGEAPGQPRTGGGQTGSTPLPTSFLPITSRQMADCPFMGASAYLSYLRHSWAMPSRLVASAYRRLRARPITAPDYRTYCLG